MSVKVTSRIDDKRVEKMKDAIQVALRTVGIHMEGAAARNAPVDLGRLKGSITWATAGTRSAVRGKAHIGDGVDAPLRTNVVHIGTNVVYAAIQEYGGWIYPVKGKYLRWKDKAGDWHAATRVFIPAQSYLRKTFDMERATVKEMFAAVLSKKVVNE